MSFGSICKSINVVQFDVSPLAPRREDVRGALFVTMLREEPQQLDRVFINRSYIEQRLLAAARERVRHLADVHNSPTYNYTIVVREAESYSRCSCEYRVEPAI